MLPNFESKLNRLVQRNGPQGQRGNNVVYSEIDNAFWSEEEASLYGKWAYDFDTKRSGGAAYRSPYFDYFYTGQDIRVSIDGLTSPESALPIYSLGYIIEQNKVPVYGFWDYCVDEKTEALTKRGWLTHDRINEDDEILSMGSDGKLIWSPILSIYRNPHYNGKMHKVSGLNCIDALVSPGHKFAVSSGELKPIEQIGSSEKIKFMGEALSQSDSSISDEELFAIVYREICGHWNEDVGSLELEFDKEEDFKEAAILLSAFDIYDFVDYSNYKIMVNCGKEVYAKPFDQALIFSISSDQRLKAFDLIARRIEAFNDNLAKLEVIQLLASLSGFSSKIKKDIKLKVFTLDYSKAKEISVSHLVMPGKRKKLPNVPTEKYKGLIWCPETKYGTFVCRRNKLAYVTGNTYSAVLRGTRTVTGAISLVVTEPDYLVNRLAEAARVRTIAKTNPNSEYSVYDLRSLDQDEVNIERYWGRHIDSNLDSGQKHIFSIHPPFNLLIRYGIQDTSLIKDDSGERVEEVREKNATDPMRVSDYNERLIFSADEDREITVLLEDVEIVNKTIDYDTNGNPILETYSFIARDERFVGLDYQRNDAIPGAPRRVSPTPNIIPGGGGGNNMFL